MRVINFPSCVAMVEVVVASAASASVLMLLLIAPAARAMEINTISLLSIEGTNKD